MDRKTDEYDKRIIDEKEDALEASRATIVKQGDNNIARRRLQAKQREAALVEELSNAQKAVEAKQEEIEVTHRLAAELSQRKSKDLRIVYLISSGTITRNFHSNNIVHKTDFFVNYR